MDILSTEVFVAIFLILLFLFIILISLSKKSKWLSRNDFENEKKHLKPNFSENELSNFIDFLHKYKGGYVKRRSGRIVYQDFTGKEKGDLKGIFWNLVFPNPNIEVKQKENFRLYLNSIGVIGLDKRPQYETRDSKIKNNKEGEEHIRKEVGNIGEKIVREALLVLEKSGYLVINGPMIEFDEVLREYDHIVIGENGVFCIETKAFGMTDGKSTKATLFIDPGDKWIIRKNKVNRELESPTEQIISAKKHLEKVIADEYLADVYPILVLSNSEIFIKNNIELDYDVVRVDDLVSCIKGKSLESIKEIDRKFIAMSIDKHRRN
ncbi:MAG: nuclease-related domain-containing protein [Lachnospiraceae bacterium]